MRSLNYLWIDYNPEFDAPDVTERCPECGNEDFEKIEIDRTRLFHWEYTCKVCGTTGTEENFIPKL